METFKDEIQASSEADLYRPLFAFLQAKKAGKIAPPYIPKYELLAPHKQCALAYFWKEAGFVREAGILARWLLKLQNFPSLWCSDVDFNEANIARCFAKLREIEQVYEPGPPFDLTFVETPKFKAALTLDGKRTGLGAIRSGVEIRSFGPQSNSLNFGIQGIGMNGWTRTAADPEIWLEMKHESKEEGLGLEFRLMGVKPGHPLSMAFYVKADYCQINDELLKPKILRRFLGETRRVCFDGKCFFETKEPQKVEIIPLAGGGCFWDAEFLLNYPLSAFEAQLSLNIS